MTTAGLGTSTALRPEAAAEQAVDAALARLGGAAPDAAIVAVTAAWGGESIPAIVRAVTRQIGCDAIVGCSVDGVLATGREISHNPAVAVLALSGVEATAHCCEGLAGDEKRAGAEIAAAIPGGASDDDLMVLFADSLGLAHPALIAGFDRDLPSPRIAGVGATEPQGGAPLVWAEGDLASESCAALLLRARTRPALVVSSGARPMGELLRVSRASGNWVVGLDGRPALEALTAQVPEPLRDPAGRPGPSCYIGLLPGPEEQPLEQGALRIRNLCGFDEARCAFALPEPLEVGQGLMVVGVDAAAARADLDRQLASLAGFGARAGLYFTCPTRGEALFEHEGVEIGYLERAHGDLPLVGLMGGYQIARERPGAATQLHIHAGVLALLAD